MDTSGPERRPLDRPRAVTTQRSVRPQLKHGREEVRRPTPCCIKQKSVTVARLDGHVLVHKRPGARPPAHPPVAPRVLGPPPSLDEVPGRSSKQAPAWPHRCQGGTPQFDCVVVGDGDELLVVFIRVFNNFREEEVAGAPPDFGLGLKIGKRSSESSTQAPRTDSVGASFVRGQYAKSEFARSGSATAEHIKQLG